MNYKLIATDFDGTLLTTDKKITEKTKSVLLNYKKNNYKIVGVTARNFSSVKRVCNINLFDYLILNNGAFLYDVKNNYGHTIAFIPTEDVIQLTNHFKDISQAIYYCTTDTYYIYSTKVEKPHDYFVKIDNLSEINDDISRMNIFGKNIEEVKTFQNNITNTFKNINSFIMQDSDRNLDNKWISINPKNTNKLNTLIKLCNELNISLSQVIFFGDGPNDIEIIKNVGLGVAMSNALPEVKKIAKQITSSNNQDGVAFFLENYLNINNN